MNEKLDMIIAVILVSYKPQIKETCIKVFFKSLLWNNYVETSSCLNDIETLNTNYHQKY